MIVCSKNKFYLAILLGCVLFMSGCQNAVSNNDEVELSVQNEELPVIELNSMFYEERNFVEAVEFVKNSKPETDIQMIVVPHHLLASRYTADLIKRASGRQIDKVFIIGPNHENIGKRPVASVLAKWQVVDGWVESDLELVKNFLADFGVSSALEVFEKEHTVGAIMPWVNYYLPQAKVIPIVFSTYAGRQEAEQVSQWLDNNFTQESLLIVSVDFSHYLTKQQADRNDEITRGLILERNIDEILQLDNTGYVDSPLSLAIALRLADKRGLKTKILYHDNSFNLLVEKSVETTSYFGIVFKPTGQ